MVLTYKHGSLLGLMLILSLTGCDKRQTQQDAKPAKLSTESFELVEEIDINEVEKTKTVDVNLGHTPKSFTRLLWKQLTGEVPNDEWIETRAAKLGTSEAPRRIDLAVMLAEEAGVSPEWQYSDPWQSQVQLEGRPGKIVKRDLGAVFMFFFTSPQAPNGGSGWANNHVPGMFQPATTYTLEDTPAKEKVNGYYHPQNPGFWYRELKDAHYAGLDFLLLNVYGPDLKDENMQPLNIALDQLEKEDGDDVIKLAMFDDTWTWGQPWFGSFWETLPNCNDEEATAKLLYEAKWKPFFTKIPRKHWYTVNDQPFIYFYNNNTLQNKENFAAVLDRMKSHFVNDFGVEPFVAVDSAFLLSDEILQSSDSSFLWYTFNLPKNFKTETRSDFSLSHAMVRWDSTSRWNDRKERQAKPDDLLAKDDAILKRVLNNTQDSDILVLATWNDLGEGTGINRAYNYYWDNEWKAPNHFMDLTRRSQAGEIFP